MMDSGKLGSLSGYIAYIPCYDNGNSVIAVDKDGSSVVINKSIRTVIKALLQESGLDIRSIRKSFSSHGRMRLLMPLPLRLGMVLVPVKVRKAIAANDGSYAYIDPSFIESVDGGKHGAIKLKCGRIIDCIETPSSIISRLEMGEVVRDRFAYNMLGQSSLREAIGMLDTEYGRAATRRDIVMLAYEIMMLRDQRRQGLDALNQ